MEKKTIITIFAVLIAAVVIWQLVEYFTYKSYEKQMLDNAVQFQKDAYDSMNSQLKNMNF
ncbi:MAG: hypothetical protein J6T16_06350 [Opitutales bacterium]|nr:hypothetical protein [Opitutales bacterium]